LLSLNLATALRKAYFRLEVINGRETGDPGLTGEERAAARRTLERQIRENVRPRQPPAFDTVLPTS
jgi:hypothetical protein